MLDASFNSLLDKMFIPISPEHSILLNVHESYHQLVTWHGFKIFEYRFFGVIVLRFALGFASVVW